MSRQEKKSSLARWGDIIKTKLKFIPIVIPLVIAPVVLVCLFTNKEEDEGYAPDKKDSEVFEVRYDAEIVTTCPEGMEMLDSECVGYKEGTVVLNYTCDTGYTLLEDQKCHKIYYQQALLEDDCNNKEIYYNGYCLNTEDRSQNYLYSCSNKSEFESTSNCRLADTSDSHNYYVCSSKADYTCGNTLATFERYYCFGDDYKVDDYCYSSSSVRVSNIEYFCEDGFELYGTTCIKDVKIDSNVELSCEDGYSLNAGKCLKKIVSEASFEYQCKDGDYLDEDTNECISYEMNTSM